MEDIWLRDIQIVVYERISTKRQSFTRQDYEIQQFANDRNLEIVKTYKEVISGYTLAQERPVFLEACRFCNEHGYTMLIDGVDRLTRNLEMPILFSMMEERGDFDIEIICNASDLGHISIEALNFSLVQNSNLISAALGKCNERESFISLCNNIKNGIRPI